MTARDRADELAEEAWAVLFTDDETWRNSGCPSDATLIAAVIRKAMKEQRDIDGERCMQYARRLDLLGVHPWDERIAALGNDIARAKTPPVRESRIGEETPPACDPSKENA